MNPRHVGIYLSNHQGRILCGGLRDVDADTQTHVAVVIRRGGLNQCHIDGNQFAMKQSRNLR
jgi:hypothetical protein